MGAKTTVEVYHRHFTLTILSEVAAVGEDVLVVEVLNDRTTGDDAYELVAVINDRNEVCLHRTENEIVNGRTYLARRILRGERKHIREDKILKVLDGHRVRLTALTLNYEPEKVAFADRADIGAVMLEHGDRRELTLMHLLESLTDSEVAVYKCYILLGTHKESYIHKIIPFLSLYPALPGKVLRSVRSGREEE